jgi:hypothetical protein
MHQPTPTGTRERHHAAPQGGAAVGGGQRLPPPRASPAPSTRPRSPAQLTSFCPALSKHLVKPANGSPGREVQLSTSCNPRILQGRGMFDGKAFHLGSESRLECRISECRISIQLTYVGLGFDRGTEVN